MMDAFKSHILLEKVRSYLRFPSVLPNYWQPHWDSNPDQLLQRENGFRDRCATATPWGNIMAAAEGFGPSDAGVMVLDVSAALT